jgi:hypothetical protein
MQGIIEHENWNYFFDEFTQRNRNRPTRMEIFGDLGAQPAEKGLPLLGVAFEERAGQAPNIAVMFGNGSHLTHTVAGVKRIMLKRDAEDNDEALVIEDGRGQQMLLRFLALSGVSP